MKSQKSMQDLWQDSYLSGENDRYLETMYESYLQNPENVPDSLREYFNEVAGNSVDVAHSGVRNYFLELAKHGVKKTSSAQGVASVDLKHQRQQEKVIDLIGAYRNLGHLQANIDPLGLYRGVDNPTLELSYYGFTDKDMDQVFDVGTYSALNKKTATLKEIYQSLRSVYCGTLGFEYMDIMQLEEVSFIQNRIEQEWAHFKLDKESKLRILDRLIVADGLEKYLGLKYVGQKRFSLEGGDTLIPLLDTVINRSAGSGLKDLVIGMAHRGRLNVLVNILGKAPEKIFAHFEDLHVDEESSGDVKYHLGYSSDIATKSGSVHISLAFNPSHLEIVSPVVQGSVRARQRRRKDVDRTLVMPIQIHGDAAFAGQGCVMETFSMSQARWFWVGGSIHIVINNQIGFTISNPLDSRSSIYCTDVAKMVQAPIIHLNGNDPEAAIFAAKLAADYRARFKKDIVIDLVCYRRHGHNEADEPSATQPLMYKIIKAMPTVATMYATKLIEEGLIDGEYEKKLADAYRKKMDEGKAVVEVLPQQNSYEYFNRWEPFIGKKWTEKAVTAVPLAKLKKIAKKLEALPEGFVLQPQVKKMMEAREKMTQGELPINWGYAEAMAFATLLEEGFPIRLCGQDACRGTFAHRHAVLHDQNTDQLYIPLSHISENQAQINLVDSLLSEEAVMAFEYGFSSTEPNNLDIWEAQFGDFANGAQVVIDQFISSGEQKWGRLCGIVLFLPHGQEGIGPEHSSARLERYLQLCAQDNIQVCVPSTPAQIFHLLRRQMIRPYRKPLIVMTPKSALRNPLAVSSLEDLSEGEFQLVIPELENTRTKEIDRVILCTGKIYFELLEKRREAKLNNIAIIRVEQLYPFPDKLLKTILEPYAHVKDWIWCQEEPANQGAWTSIQYDLRACLGAKQEMKYIGRPSMAAPSGGYNSVHLREQAKILKEALKI